MTRSTTVTCACTDGWTGEDDTGRPVPCLRCRPWLTTGAPARSAQPRGAGISERAFQQRVVDLARLRGWRVFHPHDSRHSAAGWPDLAMLRARQLVFAELKSETGRPTDEQRAWLAALSAVPGVIVRLWRPSDWSDVEAVLR